MPAYEQSNSDRKLRPRGAAPANETDFINEIEVVHGPPSVLGRFFLRADQAVRDVGIVLKFGTFEELAATNDANRESWPALTPLFDHRLCRISPETGVCIIGRDETGKVVAASAARSIDLGRATLKQKAESLELFYPDKSPQERAGYSCSLTAPSAETVRGEIIYSGATWFHPSVRRLGLARLIPKLSRSAAATKWGANFIFSFVTTELIQRNIPAAYGYRNLEWGLDLKRSGTPLYSGALIWMDQAELHASLSDFVDGLEAQIDVGVRQRRA